MTVAPYLPPLREDAGHRGHSFREVFNGLLYVVRSGFAWRLMLHDLPPWFVVQFRYSGVAAGTDASESKDG